MTIRLAWFVKAPLSNSGLHTIAAFAAEVIRAQGDISEHLKPSNGVQLRPMRQSPSMQYMGLSHSVPPGVHCLRVTVHRKVKSSQESLGHSSSESQRQKPTSSPSFMWHRPDSHSSSEWQEPPTARSIRLHSYPIGHSWPWLQSTPQKGLRLGSFPVMTQKFGPSPQDDGWPMPAGTQDLQ